MYDITYDLVGQHILTYDRKADKDTTAECIGVHNALLVGIYKGDKESITYSPKEKNLLYYRDMRVLKKTIKLNSRLKAHNGWLLALRDIFYPVYRGCVLARPYLRKRLGPFGVALRALRLLDEITAGG